MADLKLKIGVDVDQIKKDIGNAIRSASNVRVRVPVLGNLLSGAQAGVFGKPAEGVTKKEQGTASFGIGKTLGKVAVGIGVAAAILKGIQAGIQVLAKASPKFGGVLKILDRAMMLFFRPFGDFLASLLRPLAFWLLRASRAWLKFTREFTVEKIGEAFSDVGKSISEGFNEVVVKPIENFFQGAFNLGAWLGQRVNDFIIGHFNFGVWIATNILNFWKGVFNFGVWILDSISGFFTKDKFHFAGWIKDNIWDFFTKNTFDFARWLENLVRSWFGLGPRTPSFDEINTAFSRRTGGSSGGREDEAALMSVRG